MKKVLIAMSLIIIAFKGFAGGGWTQGKRDLYLKIGQQWVVFNQFYDRDGNTVSDRSRSFGTTSLYAEYGFTDKLTAILYFPFYSKSTMFEQRNSANGMTLLAGESFSSIGDTNVGVKYALPTGDQIAMSASLTLGLPLGEINKGSDGSLQTGDGEFNQMLSLDMSTSFGVGKLYPYLSLNLGLNNRTKGFSDEFRYGLEVGVGISRFNFIMKVTGVKSLFNGTVDDNLFFEGLLANNTEYVIMSPEIAVKMSDRWGVSISMAKTTSGRLMYVQPSYTIGIYLDIKN
ncbi:MAG: hypothetical protein ABJF11_17045 [Reichenbachiella sp.]|uniref:hypothetical protein n=1 Tax=Reichenbachiella sp. TaxID=2184521 RepID=UPI0032677DEB